MSKAVLISIRPKWVEKIASGEKTIEVRKTRPKLATPFKAYLYVTAGNLSYRCPNGMICHCNGGRAVIGEFVCNKVDWITRIGFSGSPVPSRYSICSHSNMSVLPINDLLYAARLTYPELADYLAGGEGYGWHISDLLIYDQPRELTAFWRLCPNDLCCETCAMYSNNNGICNNGALLLRRPPQSWCYVEEG
jgi:hypothetical protein